MRKAKTLLSVVIPTHNRPQFLREAVSSSLTSSPEHDTQVIVVPNGNDESWRAVALELQGDSRISWHPLKTANANIARNFGMHLAVGKFVRFLDDDDFFYEAAAHQLVDLNDSNDDLSQANVDVVDDFARTIRTLKPIDHTDFAVRMLRPGRLALPTSFVFKRSFLENRRWATDMPFAQDIAFALSLVRDAEAFTRTYDQTVGAWRQHNAQRISTTPSRDRHLRQWAKLLLDTTEGLSERGAFSTERKSAAAAGLWECAHRGFPSSPMFWTNIARIATSHCHQSGPPDPAYNEIPLSWLPPIAGEWVLLPYRILRRATRKLI